MKAVRKDAIVDVQQFSEARPHAILGIIDPLPTSKLYEVNTIHGHQIVRHGDFIVKDSVGNLSVVELNRFDSLYLVVLGK